MQVTVHNDAFPEDQEFELPGLGLVKNHETKEVDAIQVQTFKNYGHEWPKDGNLVIDQNEAPKPKAPITPAKSDDPPVGSSPEADTGTAPIEPVNAKNEGDK